MSKIEYPYKISTPRGLSTNCGLGGGIYSSNLPSPGGGGKIFVPLAKKWGRIFVPGDFYGNIDKIKDYFIILLNF